MSSPSMMTMRNLQKSSMGKSRCVHVLNFRIVFYSSAKQPLITTLFVPFFQKPQGDTQKVDDEEDDEFYLYSQPHLNLDQWKKEPCLD